MREQLGEELTHYALNLVRNLGYKTPSYTEYDDPDTRANEALEEKSFM